MTIYKLGDNLDTANFRLSNPVPNQGGTYFSKLLTNNNDDHFYIQTPKCKTKQGIMKTGKKKYTDLLLSELNSDFVEIITKIEEKLQDLIYSKHEIWFANTDLEMEDIQNSFVSPVKVYKGKNYLMRVNLNSLRSNIDNAIPIFNEKEMEKSLEDITQESDIISILEILGIKFSQRYFQIEINVKQIMIMENAPIFNNCLIKKDNEKLFEVKDADAQANADADADTDVESDDDAWKETYTIAFKQRNYLEGNIDSNTGEKGNTDQSTWKRPYDKPGMHYLKDGFKITTDEHKKYFSHMPYEYLEGLEIDNLYKWEPGGCVVWDQDQLHCADNFLANGITTKRSLIFFTNQA